MSQNKNMNCIPTSLYEYEYCTSTRPIKRRACTSRTRIERYGTRQLNREPETHTFLLHWVIRNVQRNNTRKRETPPHYRTVSIRGYTYPLKSFNPGQSRAVQGIHKLILVPYSYSRICTVVTGGTAGLKRQYANNMHHTPVTRDSGSCIVRIKGIPRTPPRTTTSTSA